MWICPDPLGHLQATGIDAAGRKQYLYHPTLARAPRPRRSSTGWHASASVCRGSAAPLARRPAHATSSTHERVLACAVRLLDVGMFRIGSEQYADDDGGIGLATIRQEHVSIRDRTSRVRLPGEGRRAARPADRRSRDASRVITRAQAAPRRRRELLAYRNGRRWHPLRSDEINEYLKRQLGEEFSAKDFRTWNATVMAAVSLATDGREAATKAARKRAIDRRGARGRRAAGQHARRGPAVVHRPARVRPLPVGLDDRRPSSSGSPSLDPAERPSPGPDRARGPRPARRTTAPRRRSSACRPDVPPEPELVVEPEESS